jgi:hypothetical protein
LLHWIKERGVALEEFKHIVRRAGPIICRNFGKWAHSCPTDASLHTDLDLLFYAMDREVAYDQNLGRKLPSMFFELRLEDFTVDFIPDRAFGGFGGNSEERRNWESQWHSPREFNSRVYGSFEKAQQVGQRLLQHFGRVDVY